MCPNDQVKFEAAEYLVDHLLSECAASATWISAEKTHIHIRIGPEQVDSKLIFVLSYLIILK
jgi:hypothetical protein